MIKAKRYGFTLVEVVIACSLFAIVVVGIILAINRSFAFMNNTKLSVRAANFAREGIEMVYNIRDTNWRKHSGQRDKYWLYLGAGDINQVNGGTNSLFFPGVYVIKEGRDNKNNNSYFYAKNLEVQDVNVDYFYSDDGFWDDDEVYSEYRNDAKINFAEEQYSYYEFDEDVEDWKDEPTQGKVQDVLVGEGLEFYRIVRVFGIYKKDEENSSTKLTDFTDGTPAEMRFCVKVFYRGNGEHSSELCSIMTNFME